MKDLFGWHALKFLVMQLPASCLAISGRWQLGKFNLLISAGEAADCLFSSIGKVMTQPNSPEFFCRSPFEGVLALPVKTTRSFLAGSSRGFWPLKKDLAI
jgi:hypothetical protein